MKRFFGLNWDFVGFGASLLCAIHCMLMPLVFTLGLFTGVHWLTNPLIEWFFITMTIGIASWSLFRSYFNKHNNIRPIGVASLGFLGFFVAQSIPANTHFLMAIGGALVAYAHFYNWQLLHQSKEKVTKMKRGITLPKLVAITFILFYLLGLGRVFEQKKVPPSREKMLEVVWRGRN